MHPVQAEWVNIMSTNVVQVSLRSLVFSLFRASCCRIKHSSLSWNGAYGSRWTCAVRFPSLGRKVGESRSFSEAWIVCGTVTFPNVTFPLFVVSSALTFGVWSRSCLSCCLCLSRLGMFFTP